MWYAPPIMSRWALVVVAPMLLVASCSSGAGSGTHVDPGTGGGRHDPTPPPHGDTPPTPANGARVVLEPPGHDPVVVHVEVANTDPLRQRGLMYRETLGADSGMIFVFDRSEHLVFWMHNTLVPLDMIFITSEMRVLGVVENATPQTDDGREVPGESKYVLEVNGGFARRNGIGAGTLVRFEGIPAQAEPRGGGHEE